MAAKKKPALSLHTAKKAKLADFSVDERNANKGTRRGRAAIADSLERHGGGRSLLADKKGKLIAGNNVRQMAEELGYDEVIVVPTDGKKLVIVQRTDLDLDTDEEARELAVADNRTSELNLNWDAARLMKLPQPEGMFTDREWARLGSAKSALTLDIGGGKGKGAGAGDNPTAEAPPPSTVRMVQLFLTVETIEAFDDWVKRLAAEYGTENLTDTVYEAVRRAAESLDD